MISERLLKNLSEMRIQDSITLWQQGRYSASYYLSGYCIELFLKSLIAKNFHQGFIPDKKFVNDIYTHDLNKLIALAGLKDTLNEKKKSDSVFAGYWRTIEDWNEEARYKETDKVESLAIINAINDNQNGVLIWLKSC
jgi:hypothetical protein